MIRSTVLATLMVLIVLAPIALAKEAAVTSRPTLLVGGFDGRHRCGRPIRFSLSLRNTTSKPLTVVELTDDMIHNGDPVLTLRAMVTRPDHRRFVIFPARTRQSVTHSVEQLSLRRLQPGEATEKTLQWDEGGFWHLLAQKDWNSFMKSGFYTCNERLLSTCFDRPGVYRITIRMDLEPSRLTMDQNTPHDLWGGELVLKDLQLKLDK